MRGDEGPRSSYHRKKQNKTKAKGGEVKAEKLRSKQKIRITVSTGKKSLWIPRNDKNNVKCAKVH